MSRKTAQFAILWDSGTWESQVWELPSGCSVDDMVSHLQERKEFRKDASVIPFGDDPDCPEEYIRKLS